MIANDRGRSSNDASGVQWRNKKTGKKGKGKSNEQQHMYLHPGAPNTDDTTAGILQDGNASNGEGAKKSDAGAGRDAKKRFKICRSAFYREVAPDELRDVCARLKKEGKGDLWNDVVYGKGTMHCVICDLSPDEPIVTNYFIAPLQELEKRMEDGLKCLVYNDKTAPQTIEDVITETWFQNQVKDFVESSDKRSFPHTLATERLMFGKTLLQWCCANDLPVSVQFLLQYTSDNKHELSKQLAKPFHGNPSAFVITAEKGNHRVMKELCASLDDNGNDFLRADAAVLEAIEKQLDKKGNSFNRTARLKTTYNNMMGVFHKPKKELSSEEQVLIDSGKDLLEASLVVEDDGDKEKTCTRELERVVTVEELERVVTDAVGQLGNMESKAVLFKRIRIKWAGSPDNNCVRRICESLRPCRRISFMDCFTPPDIFDCLVQEFKDNLPDQQLVLPSIIDEHVDDDERFKSELEKNIKALLGQAVLKTHFRSLTIDKRIREHLPNDSSGLVHVANLAFELKMVGAKMSDPKSDWWPDLQQLLAMSDLEFRRFNPLNQLAIMVDHSFLDKTQLYSSQNVLASLDQKWSEHLAFVLRAWIQQAQSAETWFDGGTSELFEMLDQAILLLTKMREKHHRLGGIDTVEVVFEVLQELATPEATLPESVELIETTFSQILPESVKFIAKVIRHRASKSL